MGDGRRREWRDRGELEELWWGGGVDADGGDDAELHDLASGVGFGGGEVDAGDAATEGFVGSDVAEHVVAGGHVGEVDDEVGPFGQAHQQPVAVVGGEVDGCGEEASFVADRLSRTCERKEGARREAGQTHHLPT